MNASHNHLIAKIVLIGIFVAVLIYLFHPGVGQMNLVINGEPVAQPFVPIAAMTTLLLVLGITAALGLLLFFGVGLLIFWGALFFGLLGIVLMAPYFWPMLVIIFLVIGLMSIGSSNKH
jgi:hypothetical protein